MSPDSSHPSERLKARQTFLDPTRECDVVMKGGITSGVLYPLAVCELAETYRLRNVGGTSAGAIAAAAAAAAEYGRRSTRLDSGFDGFAALPDWLATDDHLAGLFQPPAETKAARSILIRSLQGTSKLGLAASVVAHALGSRRWLIPILGMIPGSVVVASLAVSDGIAGWLLVPSLTLAGAVALAGLLVGAIFAMILNTGEALEENLYGLVSGSAAWNGSQSLSDWLTDELDRLAGIEPGRHPLTFGDLWAGPGKSPETSMPADPYINLEMQTTSLTEGRPYRLPHELGSSFCFDEQEFRKLFPTDVVDYLIECAGGETRGNGLIPLPEAARLPVVVATRMSLSFPLLLSAVPLYGVDWSMQRGDIYERCWFSDGGITSNFPVSYFDALLPSRPTFGINLRPFHPRHPQEPDERANVWIPRSNRSGIIEWWTRWPSGRGIRSVAAFLRAIADTMQNWVDNTQIRVPGYRDRIVHISHSHEEGGMNLTMPPETLAKLTERGRNAGRRLVDYYTNPPGAPVPDDDLAEGEGERVVSWENHRWVRLRTSLSLVSGTIRSLTTQFGRGYDEELDRGIGEAPGYQFVNDRQLGLAQAFMNGTSSSEDPEPTILPAGLIEIAEAMAVIEGAHNATLANGAPKPAPVFRIAPGVRPPSGQPDEEMT